MCRDFAERAFQAAKKEAAALDAGGWNVGSVITDMKDRQDTHTSQAACDQYTLLDALPLPPHGLLHIAPSLGCQLPHPHYAASSSRLDNGRTLDNSVECAYTNGQNL